MGRLLSGLLMLVGLIALILVGGYFALRRADLPYETLAARFETATSRYADLPGGVRLHYRDEGASDGPALVLVHGYAASLQTWEPWVARLGEQHRIISIDLPGHGLTRAPAGYDASIEGYCDLLAAFAEAQQLDHFALAGNSMGGNVAWEYALAHPAQVDALILVDSAGWPATNEEQEQQPLIFNLLRNPIAGPLLRNLDNTQLTRQALETSFVDQTRITDQMVSRYVDASRAPGHREILLDLMLTRHSRNFATPERLAPFTTPTLIIWGDQDKVIPPRHAELFRNAIAGSEVLMLENVGHVPQEEEADASATAAQEFLYRVYEGPVLAAE